ncbi:MAG: hypothetical protein ACW975_00975 [Candidatus Thorarchaeota archaeon]|jgi:hypothetical protein
MGWKEYVQVILFILSWAPVGVLIGTSVFNVEATYQHDFSIYNEEYDGLSLYRDAIEGAGYTVKTVQSSMSTLGRYEGNATLVITGPVVDFSVDTILVIFNHLTSGGGVLIADDFGTANSSFTVLNLLLSGALQGGGVNLTGLLNFPQGVLYDLDSHGPNPLLPIVTDFHSITGYGPILTQGVGALHLNYASVITPTSLMGYMGIAWTTPRAWCEKNLTSIETHEAWPDPDEWAGVLPVAGAIDLGDMLAPGAGRLVAVSDPSIFINDMVEDFGGNLRFGMNIINWLARGDTDENRPIVFCENLLEVPWSSPEFFFGLYLGRALWLTGIAILAPLYPLVTVLGIRKYLPDPKKPEVKSVSDVFLRRGQTYFSERMSYYRSEGNYGRVVKMLYRKLRRAMVKKYQWREFDVKKVFELLRYKDPSISLENFTKIITRLEEISSNPGMKVKENEMMSLFFIIRDIQSKLVETK